ALLAHAQAPLAQAHYEARHAARQAYVLLESRHRRDVRAADRVARQSPAQAEPAGVGELGVPRHDSRVQREADHAAIRDVGPNGDDEQGNPKFGNGATCVGIARSESSAGAGSKYAHPFVEAALEMNAL